MNKIGNLVLGMLISSNLLFGEIVFNLHAQHFSKAIEGKYEGARYELDKCYVSTNLAYTGGVYKAGNSLGYFNVGIKEPIENWSTSIDVFYIMGNSYKRTRTIKWSSENGESILVSLKNDAITFDSKNVYTPGEYQRLTITLTQNSDNVELIINGTKVGTATKETFGKLKYIDVQAIYEYDGSSDSNHDYVNGITIGSK